MVVDHALNAKVLNTDGTVVSDDVMAVVVSEVLPAELDALMHTSNDLAMFLPLMRAFRQLGVLPLHLCQGLLFLAEELRVLNFFSCGKRRKGFEPDVNAYLGLNWFKPFWFTFDRERDVPLKSGSALDRAGFAFAFDRTMLDHLHPADLGEANRLIVGDGEPRLREREAVRAIGSTKTRYPGFSPSRMRRKKAFIARSMPTATFWRTWEWTCLRQGRCCFSTEKVSCC
jgi:hypothetical protein